MKHFEQLWEEAEAISSSFCQNNASDAISEIKTLSRELYYNFSFKHNELNDTYEDIPPKDRNEEERYIGEILFWLTAYSKIRNIDVYKLLSEQLEDAKTELLEQQLGGEVDDLKDQ